MQQDPSLRPPTRRFLVLGRCGDKSLHKSWTADTSVRRNWDLQLNSYAKDPANCPDEDLPTVFDHGTKWDSIARHFRARPELLDRYDYIMLPDDDLLMKAGDINRLFEIAVAYDLTIAQPAMTPESYISYPILLRIPGFRLRYSTFLESMACCLKSCYLRRLLPMFERHFTGWGTDLVWATLMEDPAYRAAIVDAVPMTHTRPLYSGPLYSSYAEGIDPREEIHKISSSFENMPHGMQIYGGYLANGWRVGPVAARLLNGAGLLAVGMRSKKRMAAARSSAGLLLRAFTQASYRPEQLRARPGTDMARIGLGMRRPQQVQRSPRT
ncbi:DUF707 domain-containing protein [Paenirhodobacter populi]|uniref:DUF707 domain-containing protein n=1 Tax=Paenirhodobacter populi TaxID=2306993 RepID=A0A443JNS3_9RHOB|nr:DUF707 domain-containing protein [Sinirhodobacter populi]RWR08329.1 DUF707 domain-containing protein [Sinirhodobacter populi]RWR14398.1 DUF707 domain-containing protein [Sinirhodobacter populi]RWR22142.1 DUF707 domain-containing protein [Sinirhodobacter populi]RWR33783.1 DUF707 domain-containing protein [Sinirhodobacter populi]